MVNPRVVAIIQARMGSSRLPGKVLQELAGRSVLSHVIARAASITGVDTVCCAIPNDVSNDAVVAEAARHGARVHRGPEHDVLTRYAGAAAACRADIVIRITSDCPLLDPGVSSLVLRTFIDSGAEYCSNLDPRSWPRGLDTEVFTVDALKRAAEEAIDGYDREHVTPWIRRNRDLRHANAVKPGESYADYRWTLDYPEDLSFFRALYAALPAAPSIVPFDDLLAAIHRHPEIVALNAHLQ